MSPDKSLQQENKQERRSIAGEAGNGSIGMKPPAPFAAQRAISVESHNYNSKHVQAAIAYGKALDAAVDKAYLHIMSAPQLGSAAALDGHTAKWVEDWNNANTPSLVLCTSFGYAIESLATLLYLPPAPPGMLVVLQGVRPNTRPDVILQSQKEGDVAWLDITASSSAGHIWKKTGWDKMPHVTEVTYPSLETQHKIFMKKNNDVKDPKGFDPDAFKKQLDQAKKLARAREEHWHKLGKEIAREYAQLPLIKKDTAKLQPMLYKQNPMLSKLIGYFRLDIPYPAPPDQDNPVDEAIVDPDELAALRRSAPHILAALGLGPVKYGFGSGGVAAGQAWLQLNDPYLPQPEEVEDDDFDMEEDMKENKEVYAQDEQDDVDMTDLD